MEQSTLYPYCHIVERTDVGCVRAENEDWCNHFECANGLVAVVCDGMGGHVGGKVASHTAIEAIERFLRSETFDDPRQAIIESINFANQAILNEAERQPGLRGMGSTCVMLIVRDGKVYIGSVGDSRIYLIAQHRITQLTKDQSFVQMLVDAGQITAEEAEHHPRKNEITNALGLPEMKPATVREEAISPDAGFCFLLCSDGLSGMVSDSEIEKIVSSQRELRPQERADYLVELAKKNGGVDNITVELVEFSSSPGDTPGNGNNMKAQEEEKKPDKPERNLLFPLLCIAAALALIIFIIVFAQKGCTEEEKAIVPDTTSTKSDTINPIVNEFPQISNTQSTEKLGEFSHVDSKGIPHIPDQYYPLLKIYKTSANGSPCIQFKIAKTNVGETFQLKNDFLWEKITIDTVKFKIETVNNFNYAKITYTEAFCKSKEKPDTLDLVIEVPQGEETRRFVLHITNINQSAEEHPEATSSESRGSDKGSKFGTVKLSGLGSNQSETQNSDESENDNSVGKQESERDTVNTSTNS